MGNVQFTLLFNLLRITIGVRRGHAPILMSTLSAPPLSSGATHNSYFHQWWQTSSESYCYIQRQAAKTTGWRQLIGGATTAPKENKKAPSIAA